MRWVAVVVALAVLGGGLLYAVRRDGGASRTGAGTATAADAAAAAAAAAATDAAAVAAAATDAAAVAATAAATDAAAVTAPTSPPQTDAQREAAVRLTIDAVLAGQPAGVAILKTVSCTPTTCRVELEVPDMATFTPAYERLQEPNGGLADLSTTIILSTPVALGPDGTGPFLVSFRLNF